MPKTTSLSINIGVWVLFILCLIQNNGISQNFTLGIPNIHNHTKGNYKAGAQNWAAAYDSGRMFFANNGGLLEYNGNKWNVLGIPNSTILRSLAVSKNHNIYVGAQNEIGYFQHNQTGEFIYINLKDSIQNQIEDLSEVWNIALLDDKVFFSTFDQIHSYQNGKVQNYGHESYISKMSKVDKEIWYHTISNGIYKLKNDQETKIPNSSILNGYKVISFLKGYKDEIIVVTEKNGIFRFVGNQIVPWKTNADRFIKEKRISSAYFHPTFGLFIGTYLGGLIAVNSEGRITFLLDKQSGLQNNAINCIIINPNDVLWVGTNNGIDEIDLSTSFRKFHPDNQLEGAVYDMDIWNETIFFSTSNGLYSIGKQDYYNPLNERVFKLISGTEGQTWGTDIINGHLLCAHHEGPLMITSALQSKKLSDENSAWKFIQLTKSVFALGSYTGVSLYTISKKGEINFMRKIEGLEESSRILLVDKHHNLWVSHPYKNVYRIQFNDDYISEQIYTYTKDNGFKIDDRNYVFNINNTCYLTNPTGIYKYDEERDTFLVDPILNEYFDAPTHVRRLIQDNQNIYCITDQSTTLLNIEREGLTTKIDRKDFSELTPGHYIGGFENLNPSLENRLIVFSEDGAIEFVESSNENDSLVVLIHSISLPLQKDSTVYAGHGQVQSIFLKARENAIRVSYGAKYGNANETYLYSTKLSDSESEWSVWSPMTTKEYTNLQYGGYTFEVKAKTMAGIEGTVTSFSFEIDAPWYRGWKANLVYILLFLSFVFALFLIPRKKYQETTALLEDEKRETEEKMEQIKKEKLLNEIKHKNNELASSTLLLLQKNQTLEILRSKFDELNDHIKNPELQKELNKILSVFRSDLRLNDDWEKFSLHFDQVHHDFVKKTKIFSSFFKCKRSQALCLFKNEFDD